MPAVAPAGGYHECVFTGFAIQEDLKYEDLEAYKDAEVTVIAYAVQADGLSVDEAWAAAPKN